jgi:hypothetical protein
MAADSTLDEPSSADEPSSVEAPDRGSRSAWLVVALALSFVGLVAMVAMLAPAGGCGGG